MRRATFLLAFFVAAAVVGVLYLRSPHLPASLPLSPAAGGPIYVLESSVPSINAGKVYALTDTIIIPDGTSIRAVMPSGKTQTIRGPYSGPASDLAKGHRSNEGVIAWIKNIVQTGGVAERTPGDSGGPTRYPNSTTEAERRSNEDAKKRTAEARRQEEARKAAEAKRADDDYRKRMGLNPRGDPDVEGPRWLAGVVDNPCTSNTVCTLVPIFFGTDRKQVELSHRTDFGPDRASKLQLGRAVVTVPRVPHRRVGEIIVPSNLERWFSKVPPEGDFAKHFTILRRGVHVFASATDFVHAVREHMKDAGEFKEHAFIFVHGYRTTFEDGLYRVAQIAYDLQGSDGRPFGAAFQYSWQSGGSFRDYAYDLESAQYSVPDLRKFVELVIEQSSAKHLHLIAHSMGNSALLAASDEIAQSAKKPTTVNQIILAAPDFDAQQFAKVVERIVPIAKGVTLYASANDLAMKAAREVYRGVYRAGDVPPDGPIVVPGVDTIDITAIGMDVLAIGHSEYAERRELLNDLALLFRKGERPPHQRLPMFKLIEVEQRQFWRVPQ